MKRVSNGDRRALLSQRLYSLLLAFYPTRFRREYGPHMAQLFRDRQRETSGRGGAKALRLWAHILLDLARSAPKEHLERLRGGVSIMRVLKRLGLALIAYAAAFLLAGMFLGKMRAQLPLFLGSLLDALVAVGIIFNLIVLILWSTGLTSAARAVITSAVVSALLLGTGLILISSIVPVDARPGLSAVACIALSLCFWFAAHWLWAQKKGEAGRVVSQ